MKKTLLLILAICASSFAFALKVYINPGHGSWGPNDRPMPTVSCPNLSSTGRPDTIGFYESNTNLWKGFALEEKLLAAGFGVKMSRRASGPYPYTSANETYNKALTTICSEATNYGADYYISIHSNAGPEGELGGANGKFANYPVILWRGYTATPGVKNSDKMAKACATRLYEIFWATPKTASGGGGPEPTTYYSPSNPRILGDLDFYTTTSTYGYLGALKHDIPGYLSEGYFHTYSPARHRALNPDWCRQEGIRYYRGIMDYYGKAGESVGYIMGYIRSKTEKFSHANYIPYTGSNDEYKPINGAQVFLKNASGDTIKTDCYHYVKRMRTNQKYYLTDDNYNGVFVYDNLTPGTYTISVKANGYQEYTGTLAVTADKTIYPEIFLIPGSGTTDPDPTPTPTPDPSLPAQASGLNPYAYNLSSELAADSSTIKVKFYINALASTVKVIFNDGEKDYVTRNYTNVKAGGYSSVIAIDTMPQGKQLSWRVDVTGAGFTTATKVGNEYYFYHPTSVDVDHSPESPHFGRILCSEAYHEIKGKTGTGSAGDYTTYKSQALGAGIYEFDARFEYVGGYNGGNSFATYRVDKTDSKAFAPHRIRIADDGRVFVTSFNGGSSWGGKILWEVNQDNLNSWTPAFGYSKVSSTSELQTSAGEYIAAPNIGFDVQGGGDNLKLLMMSATTDCYDYAESAFRCYEYAWGKKTTWNTAVQKKWFDGNKSNNCNGTFKVINYTGANVQFDNHGGIWVCQYRASATDTYPSLVYYDKNGVYRFHEVMNNRGGGGMRFNKDFTKVIISGGNGSVGEATVYSISNDANGYPTKLTKLYTIAMNLGTSMCDYAWDYADNVYAISYTKEKLVAYATPHNADQVVSTPAMSKYSFTLTQKYTVTASANDATMGTVSGAGVYVKGVKATLTATANEGYQFVNWTINGETITTNPTIITVNSDVNAVANFAVIQHTVTATVNDPAMGSVEGAGVYNYGTTATLTATANEGYEFVGWTVGEETMTDNPLTLTVTSDVTVVANFKAIEHTVTVTVNGPAMGSVEGAGTYKQGSAATLTATASEGYEFVGWTIGEETMTENPLTLTVMNDVNVVANFKVVEYTVVASVNDAAMGSVEGAGVYSQGTTATLTATANAGYEFVGWTIGEETMTENPLTLTVTSDVTVVANFKAIEHTVTVAMNDPAMGSVEGAGTYKQGSAATLTATASEGYEFVGWTVGEETMTDNPLTLTVMSDVNVVANFKAIEHTVTVTVNGPAMGSVEGAGVYNYGTTATLTATANEGYEFVGWTVNGETLTENPLTLTVTSDVNVVANFKAIEYTVTATANDPAMGAVEGAGTYNHGATVTLTATANEGYEFVGWTVNGETLTENPLTLTITSDVNVVANFKAIEYTVTATANDPAMGAVEGAGTYNHGATATLTATANEGYEFVGWTVNSETLTENPLTLTVTSDVEVVANFKAIEYTVTATANDPAMGAVEGAGTYNHGATATLTATANEGYEFVGWTVNGETLTENPLTLTVTSDVEVVANFKAIELPQYIVTISINDSTMGSVEGAGLYEEGAIATLTAMANAGFAFVGWEIDGEMISTNPLALTIDNDIEVIAHFKSTITTDIESVEEETKKIEKIFRDGHMYIRKGDTLYTPAGARVE